jgi:hypothetical protein
LCVKCILKLVFIGFSDNLSWVWLYNFSEYSRPCTSRRTSSRSEKIPNY